MKKSLTMCLMGAAVAASFAGIDYDQTQNAIRVTDYPENMPCTLANVLQVDQMNGWNKISYDETTNTYTVNADLIIGTDSGVKTYFKIGSAEKPETVVIMNGNLRVYPETPAVAAGEEFSIWSPSGRRNWQGENQLAIGDKDNPEIITTIKFADKKNLMVGGGARRPYSGELLMYNTTITAQNPEKGDRVGPHWLNVQGLNIKIVDSKFMWLQQGLTGLHGWPHQEIRGTTFENCGFGLMGYRDSKSLGKPLVDCKFINCGSALYQCYGVILLDNCVFENNQHNWNNCSGKLLLKNCKVGEPLNGNIDGKNFTVETVE